MIESAARDSPRNIVSAVSATGVDLSLMDAGGPEKHVLFKNLSFEENHHRAMFADSFRHNLSLDETRTTTGGMGPPHSIPARRLMQLQAAAANASDSGDRKALREALYEGIFRRHRSAIFALGSFVRMLRNRNAQYGSIRNNSEGEDS